MLRYQQRETVRDVPLSRDAGGGFDSDTLRGRRELATAATQTAIPQGEPANSPSCFLLHSPRTTLQHPASASPIATRTASLSAAVHAMARRPATLAERCQHVDCGRHEAGTAVRASKPGNDSWAQRLNKSIACKCLKLLSLTANNGTTVSSILT